MVDKFAAAKHLREIAALLQLKEANPYKIKAYKQAAHALELTDQDIEQLYRDNNLQSVSGIGSAISAIISEFYSTGKIKLLDELKLEFADISLELASIEGLKLAKIRKMQEVLGIKTKEELLRACEENLLSNTPGLGKSLEKKLLSMLNTKQSSAKIILAEALDLAKTFKNYMAAEVKKIEVAGEVRRWQETVSQLDFVIETDDFAKAKTRIEKFPAFIKYDWIDDHTIKGYLVNKLSVMISLVNEQDFAQQLHKQTGSLQHLLKLEKLASEKEIGLYALRQSSEEKIYETLGLSYIPPELREDWGEVEEAQEGRIFDDLVEDADIQGMVHCHTNYSDGNSTIEQMAIAAQNMGRSYITITDHSPTAFYANGLPIDRLKRQWEEIDKVQEKVKIKILRGTESDILANGALDYPDQILEKFDVIIASIHSRYKMNEDQMTARIKTCMQLPQFKIWGHALGRLLLRRDPVPCRIDEVLEVLSRSAVAVEINGDPHRMDLEPFWLRQADKLGIKFVISTDAHSPSDLFNLPYGIYMARRAGIKKKSILNTLSYEQFKKAVQPSIN